MNHRILRKRREFSVQIRRKAVKDFRSGTYTAKELTDLYHCSEQTIYDWIYKYSPGDSPQVNVVEISESTDQKVKDLHMKISHLKRALGQKQIKVRFLREEASQQRYTLQHGKAGPDNAFSERINGVIKNEYLIPWSLSSFRQLQYYCKKAVTDYNTKRHLGSLGKCSPVDYETAWRTLQEDKRRVEEIRSENTPDFLEASLQPNAIDRSREYPYCTIDLN